MVRGYRLVVIREGRMDERFANVKSCRPLQWLFRQ